jgi:hypothetical protein
VNSLNGRAASVASLFTAFYPRPFRDEFGEEMKDVLEQSFLDADHQGALAVCWVALRELADLPANLLREYLRLLGRKDSWIMKRLSPSTPGRAGQFGALGYGLGFALLGLFFTTVMVSQGSRSQQPIQLGVVWIAASFVAGCLGGAGIGLGVDPRHIRKFALLSGSALALANTISLFAERMGFTWYLLNMNHGDISFGYSLLGALLVGPLTGLFLGFVQKDLHRGLKLAGTGLLAFALAFFASIFVGIVFTLGEAGIYTGLGGNPPESLTMLMAGVVFMGTAGALGGGILARSAVDPDRLEGLPPIVTS